MTLKKTVTLRLDRPEWEKLKIQAAKAGKSMKELIMESVFKGAVEVTNSEIPSDQTNPNSVEELSADRKRPLNIGQRPLNVVTR